MGENEPAPQPQDDVTARATLLAYLEGQLPLDEAAARYASCFPAVAEMDAEHIKVTWSGWSPSMRTALAKQIRRSMSQAS